MKKTDTHGIVVFYEPNYDTKTIKEIGRTNALTVYEALDYYANTPNPASQIITFNGDLEQVLQESELAKNITDREWLDGLFEQI